MSLVAVVFNVPGEVDTDSKLSTVPAGAVAGALAPPLPATATAAVPVLFDPAAEADTVPVAASSALSLGAGGILICTPGTTVARSPPHSHLREEEKVFVSKGNLQMVVDVFVDDGEMHTPPGLLINPDTGCLLGHALGQHDVRALRREGL
jgi:hypothetical protein